jgi:hypothetical protein
MSHGDFKDVRVTQSGQGAVANFQGEVHQQFVSSGGQTRDPLDNLPSDSMAEFLRATAKALPVLELPAEAFHEAQRTVDEVRIEAAKPKAERRRLPQLASTLYRIVEDAASQALASVLLGLWHP